jgi:hypothetical protein
MIRLLLASMLLLCVLAAPSCIAVGGTTTDKRPTTGQELMDLKTALEHGAITQAEYDQQKARILAGH